MELVRPHERQAQAIRFMIAVSPFGAHWGLAECTVQKSEGPLKAYFGKMYSSRLSQKELREAVTFYNSEQRRAAVTLRLKKEQEVFVAAQAGRSIDDEQPKFPAPVAQALQAFKRTSAGRLLAEEDMENKEPYSGEVTDLRNAALAQCLAEKK